MSALAGRRWARDVLCVVGVALVIVLGAASGDARASFGIAPVPAFTTTATEANGTLDTRAGSHPYEYTLTFTLNENEKGHVEGNLRDAITDLPPGLIGDPLAVPRCRPKDFDGAEADCPGDTQVGVVEATVENTLEARVALFNMVPPAGVPARLGFSADGFSGFLDASVRTGAGYGVSVIAHNIPTPAVRFVRARIWGVPPEASHDHERRCVTEPKPGERSFVIGCSSDVASVPFLTLPTSCDGPLLTTLAVDSVEQPGVFQEADAFSLDAGGNPVGLSGCEALPFEPAFALHPESTGTEEPTGLNVDLRLPQPESPGGLAESDLREAEVLLPEGVTVSPAAASGLTACPLSGPEGVNLSSPEAARCPGSSKVATVAVKTPLLEEELHGSVFVAEQGNRGAGYGSNPFGSLLAIYLVAEGDGVVAKIPGKIELQEGTGRLTARFGPDPATGEEGLPQLPYSELRMSFFGGPGAALVTPSGCGTYTTSAKLTPWSGTSPVQSLSSFTISQGCAPPVFTPGFVAGTVDRQAGAYTTFTESLSRNDREQHLSRLAQTLPPGLLANLASVPLCLSAQAATGSCPEASRIGSVTVQAGAGTTPLSVAGRVYLTGAYEGGPFGVAVEVPAVAGPFNLDQGEEPVTVRGSIEIDPTTAQATIVTDPFPTMLQGVPLDLRTVQVTIDRPGFIVNPTDCEPLNLAATLGSSAGASASFSTPFQAADCAALPFHPTLGASTQGQASKADGASLTVKLTSQGVGVANIRKVFLTIPRILPSRLQPTLQHACLAAVFEANPAACDEDSLIGYATVHTPILSSPLTGPAYVVSHGGAAFPDVEFVLQGEGIVLILDGKTDIKNGVTYSRFETTPDAPFTSFETVLPAGPHSIFAVNTEEAPNYDLCGHKITIPTQITAQSGATLEQTTDVQVTGCASVKASKATKAQLLAKALKACRTKYKNKNKKSKRIACERAARKKYAPKPTKTRKTATHTRNKRR